jgi:hypothetical protein
MGTTTTTHGLELIINNNVLTFVSEIEFLTFHHFVHYPGNQCIFKLVGFFHYFIIAKQQPSQMECRGCL